MTTGNPQAVPARDALDMANIRGARVLGLEKEIGSLEPGKRANMIMVRLDRPNAQPLYDAVSQMVYALIVGDVRDVMVNGKPVVRDSRSSRSTSSRSSPTPRSIRRNQRKSEIERSTGDFIWTVLAVKWCGSTPRPARLHHAVIGVPVDTLENVKDFVSHHVPEHRLHRGRVRLVNWIT